MLNAAALFAPAVIVIIGMLWNNTRIDRLNDKIDRLSQSVDDKIDRLSRTVNEKYDDILVSNHRDALEIMRQMTALHERVAIV